MDKTAIPKTIEDASTDLEPSDDCALADHVCNDLGNARRLIARHGRNMIFVEDAGWHIWDSRRFAPPPGKRAPEAEKLAHMTAAAIVDEAKALENDIIAEGTSKLLRLERRGFQKDSTEYDKVAMEVAQALKRVEEHRKFAVNSGNVARTKAMLQQAEPHRFFKRSSLDADPRLLNLHNGTLDLGGRGPNDDAERHPMRLRPHHRADLITKVAPIDFDADAKCPEFDRFLALIVPDALERAFLLRWFGYSLTSDNCEQRIVVCWGTGSNGMSTLLKAVADTLGDYAVHVPIEALLDNQYRRAGDATPAVMRLLGARLALTANSKNGAGLVEAVVKQCTGGERMTARRLYEGMFGFEPGFKLTVSSNEKPVVAPQDQGAWGRVILFPFRITLNGTENHVSERLALERPGILNRLLGGWRDYRKKGLDLPASVMKADHVGQFLSENVVMGIGFSTGAATLYQSYSRWTQSNGSNPLSTTKFGRRLADLGMSKVKRGGFIIYLDIMLKADLDRSEVD